MKLFCVALALVGCGSVGDNNKHDAAVQHDGVIDTPIDGRTCAANPTGLAARYRGEMNLTDDLGTTTATAHGAPLGYAPGKHGFAFLLDGSTNAITIDDGDTLWPAASFSIEAWVKTTTSGTVIEKYECGNTCISGVSNAYYGLSIDGSGHPTFALRTDQMTNVPIVNITDSLHDVHDGNWHHLVGVRDTNIGTGTLYVDGAIGVASNLTSDLLGPMTNNDGDTDVIVLGAEIGSSTTTLAGFMAAAIDEVSYYSSALTAQQVMDIYTAPLGECH